MILAVVIALLNLDRLVHDIRDATVGIFSFVTPTWFAFFIAIGVIKVCHELAHGIACHAGGGKCREMGLLLLFGVPCLYCDVSDAWLMPKRSHRIFVSAAGMIAECVIASVAVLVWAFTHDGGLHDLAAMIVVVASISTIVFNANPLMRYDGYFMLSDWVGVPNLSVESSDALRRLFDKRHPARNVRFLIGYAILSGLYRLLVCGTIVWLACGFTARTFGWGAAIPIGAMLGWLLTRRWFASSDEPKPSEVADALSREETRSCDARRWIRVSAAATPIISMHWFGTSCIGKTRPRSVHRNHYPGQQRTGQFSIGDLSFVDWLPKAQWRRLELRSRQAKLLG